MALLSASNRMRLRRLSQMRTIWVNIQNVHEHVVTALLSVSQVDWTRIPSSIYLSLIPWHAACCCLVLFRLFSMSWGFPVLSSVPMSLFFFSFFFMTGVSALFCSIVNRPMLTLLRLLFLLLVEYQSNKVLCSLMLNLLLNIKMDEI